MVERPAAEKTTESDLIGAAAASLEGLCVAALWTTGPDTTSDYPVKFAAMRRTPAGDWEFFEELCAAPDGSPDEIEEHAASVAADFGIDEPAWRAGRPLTEIWPDFRAFLGSGPVLVAEGDAFESWVEHLAGEVGVSPPTLGLDEIARLFAPGPLAARGAALVHELTPDTEAPSARAIAPPEIWFAFDQLARRPATMPRLAREVARIGYTRAATGLEAHDPDAAARIALALALYAFPERWAPDTGAPRPLATPVHRLETELRDPLDDLRPEWTRRARQWATAPSLPPRLEDPTPFPDEDHALLDCIFETHLPGLFGQAGGHSNPGEYRASQHQAATEVARTLGCEELLAVHAPTGTGKTLAYLVPALLWARRHGVRVGVATYTRSLQSQAMEHEVPRALSALALAGVTEGFRVSILKGRANYLCWRALCSWTPEADDAPEAWLAWTNLVVFSQTDADGDLDRFQRRAPVRVHSSGSYQDQVREGLRRVAAQSGCCTHRDDRATCGAENARRRSERSHVVLTNHSFALARQEFFKHIVFDECEHLHEVAHNAWSHSMSLRKSRDMLDRIGDTSGISRPGVRSRKPRKRGRKRGASTPLERLRRELIPGTAFHETLDRAREELQLTARALEDLEEEVRELDEWRTRARRERGERETHTLLRDYMNLPEALPLIDARRRFGAGCSDLDATLSEIAERVDSAPIRSARSVRRSMDLARADLTSLSNEIQAWLPLSDGRPSYRPETFYDVETDTRGRRSLVARVLLPAEYLGRNYYPGLKSAIFISATTWLQSGFDSALAYLGLDRAAAPDPDEQRDGCKVRTFRAPEVFDYGRVLVLIPRDAPSVARRKEDFLRYTRNFIGWLGERTRGRMLVLFTNAHDTRETGLALEGFFRPRRIPFYYQGMQGAEKEELTERFRARIDSILLGVDTFWYGADFPGATLEYLVLVKLPYGVPDLYHHAQCSALGQSEQRKRIYQPRALAKFRQGFGRLLRTTRDRGCVFVLDDRILDPRHRSFLRELPLTSPGPFGKGGHETTARLARGDTDMCARQAFEHMGLTESIQRRGLTSSFVESFDEARDSHGEPDLLRPFARDQPPAVKPWQEPPAIIDVPIDELPF